eukprot:5174861-Pyramimonas_sp.AAC.1
MRQPQLEKHTQEKASRYSRKGFTLRFAGRPPGGEREVWAPQHQEGLDTDTVKVAVKTLSSHLIVTREFTSPVSSSRTSPAARLHVCVCVCVFMCVCVRARATYPRWFASRWAPQ